ncbi:PIG-L family deacetylase [Alphaproteobacteria bacterium]|nr:PIG-L family deacetylase [Alphaproteobacteria bacterium]
MIFADRGRDVLVVAPHPDDETLGCGGTIFRHLDNGDRVHWLLCTSLENSEIADAETEILVKSQIETAHRFYGFSSLHSLKHPAAKLDTVSLGSIVKDIGQTLDQIRPALVYVPHPGDAHSDHSVVFEAVTSCIKSFRRPYVSRVLAYETLSETEFSLRIDRLSFRPNVFIYISAHIDRKVAAMEIYQTEISAHPFPRSIENIRSLATFRGAICGSRSAEAFVNVIEVCKGS